MSETKVQTDAGMTEPKSLHGVEGSGKSECVNNACGNTVPTSIVVIST